jgi:hypothetical protein
MTKKHITSRFLNTVPKSVKEWMKCHTIGDAKLLLRELDELGEDTAELQPLISDLEKMEEDAREFLGLSEEDIVEINEPETITAY